MQFQSRLIVLLMVCSLAVFAQNQTHASSQSVSQRGDKPALKEPTPRIYQAEEGDRWMLLGDKPLIFKVDPISTGSVTLVVGT